MPIQRRPHAPRRQGTSRSAIAAHAATGRADAVEHTHARDGSSSVTRRGARSPGNNDRYRPDRRRRPRRPSAHRVSGATAWTDPSAGAPRRAHARPVRQAAGRGTQYSHPRTLNRSATEDGGTSPAQQPCRLTRQAAAKIRPRIVQVGNPCCSADRAGDRSRRSDAP